MRYFDTANKSEPRAEHRIGAARFVEYGEDSDKAFQEIAITNELDTILIHERVIKNIVTLVRC